MKKLGAFLLTLSLAIFVIGCGDTKAEKAQRSKAADFELEDIDGKVFRLSDYAGKIIILNFFATWCPPCRMEMPDFNEIEKEYKNKAKIIGINVGGEDASRVRDFARNNNLVFTIAIDDGKASSAYGPIRAIPVTVIIDSNFNIAERYIGSRTKEELIVDIEKLSGR